MEATGEPAVADDTGLEVAALGGEPGVDSARFAGEDATYSDNVAKLVRQLAEAGAVDPSQRSARFRTVALVAFPGGDELMAEGEVIGSIAPEPVGEAWKAPRSRSAAPRQHRLSMVRRCCAATFPPRTPPCSSSDRCCHRRLLNPHHSSYYQLLLLVRGGSVSEPPLTHVLGQQDRDFVPEFTSELRWWTPGRSARPAPERGSPVRDPRVSV